MPSELTTLENIQRLLEAQVDSHIATAAGAAISSVSATTFAITRDAVVDAASESIPDHEARLCVLTGLLTGGAGLSASGVAAVVWRVTEDAAGAFAVTPAISTLIDFQAGSTAIGSVCAVLGQFGIPYKKSTGIGTSGTLYVHVQLDAGTATFRPVLTFVAKTPYPIGGA